MKIIALVVVSIALHATGAAAQPGPDIRTSLTSADPAIRETAARELAGQAPLTPDAKTALVDLLAKEKGLLRQALVSGGDPAYQNEGYGEYYAWLTGEVMKIADAEPDRTDVWRALLWADPGSGASNYGVWLGKHGDKTLPYLLPYAKDRRTDDLDWQNRIGALESLGQIVAYERKPKTVHHLSAAELQTVEAVIRDGLANPISQSGLLGHSVVDHRRSAGHTRT